METFERETWGGKEKGKTLEQALGFGGFVISIRHIARNKEGGGGEGKERGQSIWCGARTLSFVAVGWGGKGGGMGRGRGRGVKSIGLIPETSSAGEESILIVHSSLLLKKKRGGEKGRGKKKKERKTDRRENVGPLFSLVKAGITGYRPEGGGGKGKGGVRSRRRRNSGP